MAERDLLGGGPNLTWAPLSELGAAGIVITLPAIMPGSAAAAAPAPDVGAARSDLKPCARRVSFGASSESRSREVPVFA